MRILKNTILICSLMSVFVATNPAEALEVAAWDGLTVDTFTTSYVQPSSVPDPNVDSANSGGKIGASVTINTPSGDVNTFVIDPNGYLQFKITANVDSTITIDRFRLSTAGVASVPTTISYSETENTGYSDLASKLSLVAGTNTYIFSTPVTIASEGTAFFRFGSVDGGTISYNTDALNTNVFVFVPEPSTYVMGAAGVAVLGYAGRNRRKKAAKRSDG